MAKIPSQKEFEIALRVQAYQELFGYKFTDWHAKDVEIQIPGEGRYWVPIKDIYNTIKNFEEKKKLPEGVEEIKKIIREEVKNILNEANYKPSQVRTAVERVKKQLINKWKTKGPYENFGQKELRQLEDKFLNISDYSSDMDEIQEILDSFFDWAINYTGE
jgi:hypothetical protein